MTQKSIINFGSCSVREDFTAAVTHRHFKGLGEYHINEGERVHVVGTR